MNPHVQTVQNMYDRGGGPLYKDANTNFDRPACKPITSLPVSASFGIRDRAPDPKYYFSTRLLLLRVNWGRHGVCFSTPVCKFLAYTRNAWYQFYQLIKLFTLNTKNTIFFKYDPHYRVHTSKWYARKVFWEGVPKMRSFSLMENGHIKSFNGFMLLFNK